MPMVSRTGTFVGGACLSIAAAFFIIACASNDWVSVQNPGTQPNIYIGLWNACVGDVNKDCKTISKTTKCEANFGDGSGSNNIFGGTSDPSGNCSKLNGVRAMSVLAVILTVMASFSAIFLVAMGDKTNHRFLTLFLALAGLSCGMIAMAVFVKLYNSLTAGDASFHLGYSFILNTIAWPFGLYGSIHFGWSAMLVQ